MERVSTLLGRTPSVTSVEFCGPRPIDREREVDLRETITEGAPAEYRGCPVGISDEQRTGPRNERSGLALALNDKGLNGLSAIRNWRFEIGSFQNQVVLEN